jgi:hypothetical protein
MDRRGLGRVEVNGGSIRFHGSTLGDASPLNVPLGAEYGDEAYQPETVGGLYVRVLAGGGSKKAAEWGVSSWSRGLMGEVKLIRR